MNALLIAAVLERAAKAITADTVRLADVAGKEADITPFNAKKLQEQYGLITIDFKLPPNAVQAIARMFGAMEEQDTVDHSLMLAWKNRKKTVDGRITFMTADIITWQQFIAVLDGAHGVEAIPALKTASKVIKQAIGISKPAAPRKVKPKFSQMEIARLPIDIKTFDENDKDDISLLHDMQSTIERSVDKIRKTFGVRAKFPAITLDFTVNPPSQGQFDPNQDRIILYPRAHQFDGDSIAEKVKTFAHEFGHFVLGRYVDDKARKAWTQLVESDQKSVDLKEIGNAWKEGESVTQFMDRLKAEDPFMAIKAEYVLLYMRKGSKIVTRNELLRSNSSVRLSDHPVSPYGHSDPEEAFCEAFALLIAYGPRTVHPLVKRWMQIVLPEANVTASMAFDAYFAERMNDPAFAAEYHAQRAAAAIASSTILRPAGWKATSDEAHELLKSMHKNNTAWRGMTHEEFNATIAKGLGVKSRGDFSLSHEGTQFSDDPRTAESYVNFGRTDPRVTRKPTYLVEVQAEELQLKPDGYLETKPGIGLPQDSIIRIFMCQPDTEGNLVMEEISVPSATTAAVANQPSPWGDDTPCFCGHPVGGHMWTPEQREAVRLALRSSPSNRKAIPDAKGYRVRAEGKPYAHACCEDHALQIIREAQAQGVKRLDYFRAP